MSPVWIAFVVGAFLGSFVGVVVMAAVIAGARADDQIERRLLEYRAES